MEGVVAVDSLEREESKGKCSEWPVWGCLVIAETPDDFIKATD